MDQETEVKIGLKSEMEETFSKPEKELQQEGEEKTKETDKDEKTDVEGKGDEEGQNKNNADLSKADLLTNGKEAKKTNGSQNDYWNHRRLQREAEAKQREEKAYRETLTYLLVNACERKVGNKEESKELSSKPAAQTRKLPTSFIKVNQLQQPGSSERQNLIVKVVSAPNGRSKKRVAECVVGDETGMITFVAKGDQVDSIVNLATNTTLILHNAEIQMFKGLMRLVVDDKMNIERSVEPASFTVNQDNHISKKRIELVNIDEGRSYSK